MGLRLRLIREILGSSVKISQPSSFADTVGQKFDAYRQVREHLKFPTPSREYAYQSAANVVKDMQDDEKFDYQVTQVYNPVQARFSSSRENVVWPEARLDNLSNVCSSLETLALALRVENAMLADEQENAIPLYFGSQHVDHRSGARFIVFYRRPPLTCDARDSSRLASKNKQGRVKQEFEEMVRDLAKQYNIN